jgi:hypothetical protein
MNEASHISQKKNIFNYLKTKIIYQQHVLNLIYEIDLRIRVDLDARVI